MLFDPVFLSVAINHLIVDVLNGQSSVIFTYLSGLLGMSNATLALVSTLYSVAGALTQPIFGYLSDRVGARWVIAVGVGWMAAFFSIGMLIPEGAAVVFLVLAAVGSGAFHPAGTMQATALGRAHFADRETTASSYFFIFGQAGLFIGPLIAGQLLDRLGRPGLVIWPVLAAPIGLAMVYRLRPNARLPNPLVRPDVGPARVHPDINLIFLLALVAAGNSWISRSMIVFIPKYLNDLGLNASVYGGIVALFTGGSAIGLVAGGRLADRFGKRRVVVLSFLLASIPLMLIPEGVRSGWMVLVIPIAGVLSGASHSILVVIAQRFFPQGMGLASGLILGFMFTSGSLGALASGFLADAAGLAMVFPLAAALAVLTAILASRLPPE